MFHQPPLNRTRRASQGTTPALSPNASSARGASSRGAEPLSAAQVDRLEVGAPRPDLASTSGLTRRKKVKMRQRPIASAKGKTESNAAYVSPGLAGSHYHPDSRWPTIRGDLQNTGCNRALLEAPVQPHPSGNVKPIHIRTEGSIFSTPIIGPNETVMVGSADKTFYAFDALNGRKLWQFKTKECIDSAACIDDRGIVYVPSCDGRVYALDQSGQEKGRFDALKDRPGYSPSTIYWWEAHIVIGPTGHLYAGNDNFYIHSIARDMKLNWATTTGMNVWSTPAFDEKGRLFAASFDMRIYRMNAKTGRIEKQTGTNNLIAASPAIQDGRLFIGNFSGDFMVLDAETFETQMCFRTGGPIYASAALAPDGIAYCGSSDGIMYAFDPKEKKVVGTFYTGDVIRSSAAIGPDPEGKAPYLVYFGGGNGLIYALEPRCQGRRYSYDTRRGNASDYPNINASIALGEHGLATASANGDIIYLPYHYYLAEDAEGIDRRPDDGFPANGAFFQSISPGGTQADGVLPATPSQNAPITLESAQTMSLRLLNRGNGQAVPGKLVPGSVQVEITPPLAHEVTLQPSGGQLNILPTELPNPGQTYDVRVSARLSSMVDGKETFSNVTGALVARAAEVLDAPSIDALKEMPFRISHMAIYDPAMVPSFDQIGIASLSIDTRVVATDETTGRVSALGLLKFGSDDAGESVGVPDGRNLLFALGGRYENGQLLLEAKKPWFEITAFPVPLDRLRFAGRVPAQDEAADGGSLFAEVKVPSFGQIAKSALRGQKLAGFRVLETMNKAKHEGRTWGEWARSFIPARTDAAYLTSMAASAWRVSRLTYDALTKHPQRTWEMMDENGLFTGVGTYRSTALPKEKAAAHGVATLESLGYDAKHRALRATLAVGPEYKDKTSVPALLLVDGETGVPVPIDYNSATSKRMTKEGKVEVSLDLAGAGNLRGRPLKAIALVDLATIGEASVRV